MCDSRLSNHVLDAIIYKRANIIMSILENFQTRTIRNIIELFESLRIIAKYQWQNHYLCNHNVFQKRTYIVFKYIWKLVHSSNNMRFGTSKLLDGCTNLRIVDFLMKKGKGSKNFKEIINIGHHLINNHYLKHGYDFMNIKEKHVVYHFRRYKECSALYNILPVCDDVKKFSMRFIGFSKYYLQTKSFR